MKRIAIIIMCMMPVFAVAQDNTWERIELEETTEQKANPDQKYLEGAVPMVNGKVEFSTVINAPGKSKTDIYDIAKKYLVKMTKEANQTEYEALQREMMTGTRAKVVVKKDIYPGTQVSISDASCVMQEKRSFCCLERKNGEIVINNM